MHIITVSGFVCLLASLTEHFQFGLSSKSGFSPIIIHIIMKACVYLGSKSACKSMIHAYDDNIYVISLVIQNHT